MRPLSSWEDTFTSWARGPGTTEQAKAERAETAIRKAIAADARLSGMDITVLAQGSYRNRTNVRQNSDVDICVRLNSTFYPDYPSGTDRSTFGHVPGSVSFSDYKQWVGEALNNHFGGPAVTRGDKAFNIHENTYRIDADVLAAFEHRRYQQRSDGTYHHLSGIEFETDAGRRTINWPEQNYVNGVAKHEATGRRYRKMVRILKRLRDVMQDKGIAESKNVASCLIEALVWNVPDEGFDHSTYADDVRYVIAHAFNNTRDAKDCKDWGEVNNLMYLFHSSQPWTRVQANQFLDAAWSHIGFK
jgi:hypothetical protein